MPYLSPIFHNDRDERLNLIFFSFNPNIRKKLETGKINFDGFAAIASDFLDEEDDEAMQSELREAFRMYDKEGNDKEI